MTRINKKLSPAKLWELVSRADTHEKILIAEAWIRSNVLISTDEYDDLMRALSFNWQFINRLNLNER